MSSYYSTQPSGGAHWQQSSTNWQNGAHQHDHQQPQQQQTFTNGHQSHSGQVYAMQLLMHQMQHFPPPTTGQQPQTQTFHVSTPPAPTPEPRKMTAPTVADNALLSNIIHEQTKRGLSYKAALESLHGHNGIMAFAWKDYYLENKDVIDEMVSSIRDAPPPPMLKAQILTPPVTATPEIATKPPTQSSPELKPLASPQPVDPKSKTYKIPRFLFEAKLNKLDTDVSINNTSKQPTPPRAVKRKPGRPRKSDREKPKANGKPSKPRGKGKDSERISRRTQNSLSSAPSNDLLHNVPPAVAIDSHTGLPAAPSRSPSPPPAGPSSRYTETDTIFFYRRIAYDLKRDPNLTKNNLCDILGQKAPNHTALSWRTHWAKHEKVADKMYLLTELFDEVDREAAIKSWKDVPNESSAARRAVSSRAYRESSSDDDDDREELLDSDSSSDASGSSSGSEESSDSSDDDTLGTTEDEELGESGTPFTIAENRVLAKFIATKPDWHKGRRDWAELTTMFPETKKRSLPCWKEYYRRKAADIDKLVKKYVKKAKQETNVSAQRGRPSWARSGNVKKRRMSGFITSRDPSEEKRAKIDDD